MSYKCSGIACNTIIMTNLFKLVTSSHTPSCLWKLVVLWTYPSGRIFWTKDICIVLRLEYGTSKSWVCSTPCSYQRRTQKNKDGSFWEDVAYEVLSIHLKRWCNKNELTGTVLCLKRQCLLNIYTLKREMTTVRYSIAIIMFWFFGDGHLAIPMGHTYYSDLLELNKNNMNEGQFLMF